MDSAVAKIHAILDYLITEAAVSGKVHKATYRIPYLDLKQSIEAEDFDYEDLDLEVRIRLKWVETEENLEEFHEK